MKLRSILSALLLTVVVAAAPTGNAAIIVSIQQSGSEVLATVSGSADTTGFATMLPGTITDALLFPAGGTVVFGPGDTNAYTISGPADFGSGNLVAASSVSGSSLGLVASSILLLPNGYVSGAALSASMTFGSTTLAGLGLTDGVYTWTWGSGANADSLTLTIGAPPPPPPPSAVPVPASLLLLATGVAAVTTLRRRRTS